MAEFQADFSTIKDDTLLNSCMLDIFHWGRKIEETSKLWLYSPNVANIFIFITVGLEIY